MGLELLGQEVAHGDTILDGRDVDDGGLVGAADAVGDFNQVRRRARLAEEADAEIGAVGRALRDERLIQGEALDDVIADPGHSGGCEGHDRDLRIGFSNFAQAPVFLSEIMSPRGHAMSFVDSNHQNTILGHKRAELAQEPRGAKLLRREVHDEIVPPHCRLLNLIVLVGRSQEASQWSALPSAPDLVGQVLDLITHQRNQRRHNKHSSLRVDRRELVANGFSRTRRPENTRILAV
mmetsp:Transcript_71262/g.190252  ORF Transcript_71262/g.190252 Transcript_71262/m.190252 type:complete len:236 (+) Transcript_71262:396-1103(+)